jgi:multiple sugar transport system permease protein
MAVARRRRPLRPATVARIAFVGFWLLFLLIPLYWMFITSIKPSNDYLAVSPIWFPDERTLLHYTAALYAYRGLDGLINSLIISTSATILSAFFGTLMAYSLARFNTGGQHLSFWVLSQRFLPPIAVVLPIFLIYRVLRLNDTHVGLIIAYTVFTVPVSVWMMFAYFRQMPGSLEEAALVDGCTRWQSFWRVAVPLAVQRPLRVTTSLSKPPFDSSALRLKRTVRSLFTPPERRFFKPDPLRAPSNLLNYRAFNIRTKWPWFGSGRERERRKKGAK